MLSYAIDATRDDVLIQHVRLASTFQFQALLSRF